VTTISERDLRLIRLHVDYVRRTGATARTLYHRRENLLRFAKKLRCDLLDATAGDLDTWQSGLRVSLSSIATYSSHVRSFYRWAVETGHIENDPSHLLPQPKVPARRPRPIPADDLEVVLACAKGRVRIWIILGVFMGLRAFEIAQTCREDVSQGIIAGERRWFISGIGKGAKPYKLVVPTHVMPELQVHLTTRSGPLWRDANDRAIAPHGITKEVTAFYRSLGMAHTHHSGRHTFGTEVQQQTKDLLETQVLMRHSNPATTLQYVDPGDAAGIAALDRLSAALRPESGSRRRKPPRSKPGREAS
jgi:integrase/recombinase XerC